MIRWTAPTLGRGAEDRAQSGLDKGDLGEFRLDQAITCARIERPRVAHSRLNRAMEVVEGRGHLEPFDSPSQQPSSTGNWPSGGPESPSNRPHSGPLSALKALEGSRGTPWISPPGTSRQHLLPSASSLTLAASAPLFNLPCTNLNVRRPSSGQPGAADHTGFDHAASRTPPTATGPRPYAGHGHGACRARSSSYRSRLAASWWIATRAQ